MFCSRCGTYIASDSRFCYSCGSPTPHAAQLERFKGTLQAQTTPDFGFAIGFLVIIALAAVFVFAAGGPTPVLDDARKALGINGQNANVYPATVVTNFMYGCSATGGSQSACSCALAEVEKRYTLEEFTSIDSRYYLTGQFPAELVPVITKCAGS